MNILKIIVVITLAILIAYSGGQLCNAMYWQGYKLGETEAFNMGYQICWNSFGMHWLGSRERFLGFQKEYGNIHNTPWDKFTIEEKCVIAMYGGSGSKLKGEELREFAGKYGVK